MQHPSNDPLDDPRSPTPRPWCAQALDSLGDPLHVVDRDLRILSLNRAFREWLGLFGIEESAEGQQLPDAFPFLLAKVYDEYQYVFETGETLVTSERTLLDEREVFTETRKIPVLKDGKVVRVVTVIKDVTDQQLFESLLQDHSEQFYQFRMDSDQRFRAIFDASPVSICVFDRDGILTDANPACARLFGLSSTNALLGFNGFTAPDMSEWVIEQIRKGEQVDFEWVLDMDHLDRGGRCEPSRTGTIHIGVIVSPLLDNESVKGWVAQMQDITRWRYAQMELQHAQEVAMGYMDIMTHDIANHLQSMILCTGLLGEAARNAGKGHILATLDEAIADCIEIIKRARNDPKYEP